MFKWQFFTFLVVLLLLSSCGKEAKESSDDPGERVPQDPEDTRLDTVIQGQKLECEKSWQCPENITKIVITGQKFLNHCTGILIKNDEVLTSASCLPKSLRIKNIDCSNSAFFVFPTTDNKEQVIRRCDKVVYSDLNVWEDYPELWKNDMAILKLQKPVDRKVVKINRNGVDPGVFSLWKVDVITDKLASLRQQRCELLNQTYLNPFSDNAFSGMFVATGCELESGNAGAALLADDNSILGIYAQEMSEKIYNYLEGSNVVNEEMGRYYHFSNTSCMSYSPESSTTVTLSKICSKLITSNMLDRFRANMLRNKQIHQEYMEKVEEVLELPNKYFLWDVKFFASASGRSFEAHYARPKCIYKINSWIDEFSKRRRRSRVIQTSATIEVETPHYIFHTKLNKSLQPVSVVEMDKKKIYRMTFNPYLAFVKDNTSVQIESFLDGRDHSEIYEDITDKCP